MCQDSLLLKKCKWVTYYPNFAPNLYDFLFNWNIKDDVRQNYAVIVTIYFHGMKKDAVEVNTKAVSLSNTLPNICFLVPWKRMSDKFGIT